MRWKRSYDARTALWCLVPDDKRGEVLLKPQKRLGRPHR
jgi:magnesium transporter